MLGLKRRHTYDELLNIIKSDGEKKVELPNRIASQIRGSIKYQGLLNDHLNELQEIQNKVHKQSILTHEIRQQKGTGNHQINMRLSNDGDNDGDNDSAMPPLESIDGSSSTNNTSSSSSNNTSSSSSSSSSSDITSTISSVESELERIGRRRNEITKPDTEYMSVEDKMMKDVRTKLDEAITKGSTIPGAYDKKMDEMMTAFFNLELTMLGPKFADVLKDIHQRIQEVNDPRNFVYWSGKIKEEEQKDIREHVDILYQDYLKFKAHVHVKMPEYPSILKAVRVAREDAGKGIFEGVKDKNLLKYKNKETVRIDKVNN